MVINHLLNGMILQVHLMFNGSPLKNFSPKGKAGERSSSKHHLFSGELRKKLRWGVLLKKGQVFSIRPNNSLRTSVIFVLLPPALIDLNIPICEPQKNLYYFPLYCLVNRDPYIGLS